MSALWTAIHHLFWRIRIGFKQKKEGLSNG